jgi:ribosomal protein S18 acetylase RimI-like enzyme
VGIKYRIASEIDQGKLVELDTVSSDKVLAGYNQKKKNLLDVEEYFKSGGCFWVAEKAGNIVGMVAVRFLGGGRGKVKALRVHPDFRRQGIAKQLMDNLEKYCLEHSIKELVLGVMSKSVPAVKLYELLGYNKIEEKEVESGVIACYYRKVLK